MKRTNIVLNDKLVKDCQKASQTKILELKGKVHWEGNLKDWRLGRGK